MQSRCLQTPSRLIPGKLMVHLRNQRSLPSRGRRFLLQTRHRCISLARAKIPRNPVCCASARGIRCKTRLDSSPLTPWHRKADETRCADDRHRATGDVQRSSAWKAVCLVPAFPTPLLRLVSAHSADLYHLQRIAESCIESHPFGATSRLRLKMKDEGLLTSVNVPGIRLHPL